MSFITYLGAHNVPDFQKQSIILFISASKIINICQNQQSIPLSTQQGDGLLGRHLRKGWGEPPLLQWRIPIRKGAVLSLDSAVGMNQTMHTLANVDK